MNCPVCQHPEPVAPTSYEEWLAGELPWPSGTLPVVWIAEHWRHYVWPIAQILRNRLTLDESFAVSDGDYLEECVYFLMNDWEIFYVGRTHEQLMRFENHAQRFGERLTHISEIRVPRILAGQIEGIYIHALRPPANARYWPLHGWARDVLREVQPCRP